jgi:hypothetical protein
LSVGIDKKKDKKGNWKAARPMSKFGATPIYGSHNPILSERLRPDAGICEMKYTIFQIGGRLLTQNR